MLDSSFEFQPILTGTNLKLRPLQEEDYNELLAVASDPKIWAQHPVSDRYKEDRFREFFRDSMESGGTLAVLNITNDHIIGSSRFYGYDAKNSEIEIGWTFLARTYWGGQYNGEMKRLMLRHAFQYVDRVVLLVSPQNLRSQRAVEKIGGVQSGFRPDGGGRDSIVYEITANTFPRL